MATEIERLTSLKDEIEQAKLDKARIEGALAQNLTRLKTEFNVTTLKAAKEKLSKLQEQKEDLAEGISAAVKKLEGAYSW